MDDEGNFLPRSFRGVQLLRFVAALMVVVTHATFYVSTRIDAQFPLWEPGAQGVAIFFVISGFVLSLTTTRLVDVPGGWWRFLRQRIIRIVPLYWAVNGVKFFLWLCIPWAMYAKPDSWNVIASLLFFPARNSAGVIEPFYGVGWTLNFEMFFYFVLAFAIFLQVRRLPFVAAVLVGSALASLLRTDQWPAPSFLLDLIVLNFLWGMIIANAIMAGTKVPSYWAAAMVIAGAWTIFYWPQADLLGLQYAALVAGVVSLEAKLGARVPQVLIFGGASSYAVYLVHPMVGVIVAMALGKVGTHTPWIAISLIVISSLSAGALVHVYFEIPLGRLLRGGLGTIRTARTA